VTTPAHGGGCLCGGVRYQITGPRRPVVFCHCNLCRVQGSIATVGVSRGSLRLLEAATLRSYESSDKARRWFCGVCGAAIYWDPIGEPFVAIFAGSLDQPTGLGAMAHIYVAEAPDYYCVTDGLRRYDGPMHPDPAPAGDVHDAGVAAGPGGLSGVGWGVGSPELQEEGGEEEVEDTAVEMAAEDTAPDRWAGGSR
jgi:hypothetical protein